jgi:hypothetical protein
MAYLMSSIHRLRTTLSVDDKNSGFRNDSSSNRTTNPNVDGGADDAESAVAPDIARFATVWHRVEAATVHSRVNTKVSVGDVSMN